MGYAIQSGDNLWSVAKNNMVKIFKMDNGDNALDENEFQSYYQHLDEYTTDEKADKTAEKIVRNLLSLD